MRLKRAYTVGNILSRRTDVMPFEGEWLEAVGEPERRGTWIVYGPPKNGKTSFTMKLSKYLTEFGRVMYVSIEEGTGRSFALALERAKMMEVADRWTAITVEADMMTMEDFFASLLERLRRKRSPDIVFIDSVQFLGMRMPMYYTLKKEFPDKLFVMVSHVVGGKVDGCVARRIMQDARCIWRIEHFKAHPQSRYGGNMEPIIISPEKVAEYYGPQKK